MIAALTQLRRHRAAGATAVLLAFGWVTACRFTGPGDTGGGAAVYAPDFRPEGSAASAPGQVLPLHLGDMYFKPNSVTTDSGAVVRSACTTSVPPATTSPWRRRGSAAFLLARPSSSASRRRRPYLFCDVPGHAADGMVSQRGGPRVSFPPGPCLPEDRVSGRATPAGRGLR